MSWHVRFVPITDIGAALEFGPLCAISKLVNTRSLLTHRLMVDQLKRVG